MNAHFADLRQGDFDVAWAGWIGESNAEHYLGLLASDVGDVNYGAYHSAKFDQLIGQARTHADVRDAQQVSPTGRGRGIKRISGGTFVQSGK